MGAFFVLTLFSVVCLSAIWRPKFGIVGFYAFLMLDPAWNWHWALPQGFAYQKYIFYSLFAGFLLSGFRIRRQSPTAKRGLLALGGFVGWCYLAATQTINPADTEFFLSILWKIALTASLAILLLDKAKHIAFLLVSVSIMQGYNALQINLDYFQTGFSRYAYSPWGSYGVDNNGYSLITVPVLATSLAIALTASKKTLRVVFFGVALLQIHQIMLMASRGSMLGGLVSAAMAVCFMPRTRANTLIVGGAFLASILLAGPFVMNEFSSSFASGGERDSSAESRFYLWRAGLRITRDYPILGVGPNAPRRLVPKPEYYEGGLTTETKALHNLYLDVSAGTGIPGFLLFAYFLFLPLWHCYRCRQSLDRSLVMPNLAVLAGVPGYAVASMFNSGVLFESGYILPIVGYAFSNALYDSRFQQHEYSTQAAFVSESGEDAAG